MADEPEAAEGTPTGDGGDPQEAKAPQTLTQEQVNAIVAARAAKAAQAERQRIAEALGGVSLDEVKQILAAQKAAEDAKLSDAEKRQRAAKDAERRAADTEAAAAQRLLRIRFREALIDAGAPSTVGSVLDLAALGLSPDSDDEAVAEAVNQLKGQYQALFRVAPSSPRAREDAPPSGGAAVTPPRGQPKVDGIEAGKQRAAKLYAAHTRPS